LLELRTNCILLYGTTPKIFFWDSPVQSCTTQDENQLDVASEKKNIYASDPSQTEQVGAQKNRIRDEVIAKNVGAEENNNMENGFYTATSVNKENNPEDSDRKATSVNKKKDSKESVDTLPSVDKDLQR
jgi:hypothetical protein